MIGVVLNLTEFMKLLEFIGTTAFSVSGALVACSAGLDIFGVVFVGCITAFGGGIVRDLLLGIAPPAIFSNYIMFVIAMLSAVIVFIFSYMNKERFDSLKSRVEYINDFFDAIGLAVFSVTGAEVGFTNGYSENILIIITAGMITGVGGGIIRDILIDTTPYIFKKRIYALASIFGSLLYYILKGVIGNVSFASVLGMLLVIVIRILAMKYCWSLPKVQPNIQKSSDII